MKFKQQQQQFMIEWSMKWCGAPKVLSSQLSSFKASTSWRCALLSGSSSFFDKHDKTRMWTSFHVSKYLHN